MQRRHFLIGATAALASLRAQAHHGWSSFNETQAVYIEGTVRSVRWQNPHAEIEVTVPTELRLPPDLATRKVPAQTNPIDIGAVLANARLPDIKATTWMVELAPLFRMEQWRVPTLKAGERVALVGYVLARESRALMRAEVLMVGDQAYGLRSSPQ